MSEELKAAQARIACLEGEIAKRDEELAACRVAVENCEMFRARIVELEARIVWLECEAQVNATPVSEANAQGVVMPEGWIPLTIEHEPGYPEDVAFGPKRMMDRLKKWLDRYFEMRLNAAHAQQVSVPDGFRAVRHQQARQIDELQRLLRMVSSRGLTPVLTEDELQQIQGALAGVSPAVGE